MPKEIKTKIAVLGGGPAGYISAIRASQLGADVVLVESKHLGGVCMNVGCIPTKALLRTSEIMSINKKAREFGIGVQQTEVNWNTTVERKNRIVKNLSLGLSQILKSKGVQIINGKGTVLNSKAISVETEEGNLTIHCEKMILSTGLSPTLPQIKGMNINGVLTSDDILDMKELPKSLIIIGGGVIGVEFAEIFAAAGVKITVLEMEDSILPYEDEEISVELQKILKRKGINFKLSVDIKEIKSNTNGLITVYKSKEKYFEITSENVLIAAGRKLNKDAFNALELVIDKNAVIVDEHMETNIKGVYAAGDIIGGKLLAHIAFLEGKTAAENALGIKSTINYKAVPACVYTTPEIATVGLNEEEAKKKGISVKTGRFEFRNNGRALTLGVREGFVKIVTDESDVIIGGQIFGAEASELISEITLAVTLGATATVLADMIHPHPTLSEAVWEACNDAIGRPIHKI